MRISTRLLLALLACSASAGCAATPPPGPWDSRLAEVQAFADASQLLYGTFWPLRVALGGSSAGEAAHVSDGFLLITPRALTSPHRLALVAHELGHYVLGHVASPIAHQYRLSQPAKEMDANAKAVEILVRLRGMSEGDALRLICDYLLAVHRLPDPSTGFLGHASACEEVKDLLRRFPQYRAWTVNLKCAPAS